LTAGPSAAESWLLPSQFNQGLAQPGVAVWPGFVAVGGAIQLQQLAGLALAQPMLGHHERHIAPLLYKLHPFFRITVCKASLSSDKSATRFFNRAFSCSRSRNRRASFPSSPP
jgi:hypothetical protein